MLIDLNDEVYNHRIENLRLSNITTKQQEIQIIDFEKKIHERRWMVLGEGVVFLSLLGWGLVITSRAFRKEMFLEIGRAHV